MKTKTEKECRLWDMPCLSETLIPFLKPNELRVLGFNISKASEFLVFQNLPVLQQYVRVVFQNQQEGERNTFVQTFELGMWTILEIPRLMKIIQSQQVDLSGYTRGKFSFHDVLINR